MGQEGLSRCLAVFTSLESLHVVVTIGSIATYTEEPVTNIALPLIFVVVYLRLLSLGICTESHFLGYGSRRCGCRHFLEDRNERHVCRLSKKNDGHSHA